MENESKNVEKDSTTGGDFHRRLFFPILSGLLLLFLGVFVSGFFGLYYKIYHLDTAYHFLGGILLAWFFYIWFFNVSEMNERKGYTFISVVAMVSLAGVFWEFAERLSTIYSAIYAPWLSYWFSGGNLDDTLIDLLADILGAVLFLVILFFQTQRKQIA